MKNEKIKAVSYRIREEVHNLFKRVYPDLKPGKRLEKIIMDYVILVDLLKENGYEKDLKYFGDPITVVKYIFARDNSIKKDDDNL